MGTHTKRVPCEVHGRRRRWGVLGVCGMRVPPLTPASSAERKLVHSAGGEGVEDGCWYGGGHLGDASSSTSRATAEEATAADLVGGVPEHAEDGVIEQTV